MLSSLAVHENLATRGLSPAHEDLATQSLSPVCAESTEVVLLYGSA